MTWPSGLPLSVASWSRGMDERVRNALQRLRVPRRDEVQALTARVDRVAERLEKLERGG